MGLGIFQQSTLAMMGQSHKLNTISQNISNINTDGYKRTDTEFQTLISRTYQSSSTLTGDGNSGTRASDMGGVRPIDFQRITQPGQIRGTDRSLDAAIIGDGFFMVSPDINVNSNILYTRRGSFGINITDLTDTITLDDGVTTATVNQGYLADQFGNFVLGVPVNTDGTFSLGTPAPMRIDQFAFSEDGISTGFASLDVNLPANDADGTVQTTSIKVVDTDFEAQNLRLDFTKVFNQSNLWDFRVLGDNIASVTSSPGATYSPVTTREYDPLNPTLPTDAVRFSTGTGNGGVITVFSDLNPGGTPQIGVPQAGTFAGLKAGDSITIAGGSNAGTYTIASVADNQAEITLASATPLVTDEVTGSAITFSSTADIPQRLEFGNDGAISSDSEYTFNVTFDSGATASFTFDVSEFTQFSGDYSVGNYEQNGAERADLQQLSFGSGGEVIGDFTDGTRRSLYKMVMAVFPNPDGLEIATGQNFRPTPMSGDPTEVFADESGFATILGNALEGSNVDLATEMSRLIAAQAAYNVAATSFKTADEMLQEAAGLKR